MATSYASTKRTDEKKRLYIWGWMAEQGCSVCGDHDPRVLEAHHVDPSTKNPRLRKGVKLNQLSYKDIDAELAKCEVLCCNDHRRRHWEEGW